MFLELLDSLLEGGIISLLKVSTTSLAPILTIVILVILFKGFFKARFGSDHISPHERQRKQMKEMDDYDYYHNRDKNKHY